MGPTGFCEHLRVSSGFPRKSAPPKCSKFQEKQTSAKICENLQKLRIWLRLSLLVCPSYSPRKVCTQSGTPYLIMILSIDVSIGMRGDHDWKSFKSDKSSDQEKEGQRE